ncbi:MAG: hypothetical protein JSS23_12390 [Proteobacteria bacterium]|nr:hypothetical protein [Pseudomonadota bacterium]
MPTDATPPNLHGRAAAAPSAHQIRPPEGHFIAMLTGKSGGVTLHDLDIKLAAAVRACLETGRPATLTYTVKIKQNARRGVKVLDEAKLKLPEEEKGESFFFANAFGCLMRNNPEGPDLPGLVVVVPEDQATPIKIS